MIRAHALRICLAAVAVTLAVAGPAAAQADEPDQKLGEPSKAVTQEILDAIAAELERSMSSLQIPGAEPPYFIAYKITEVDVNDVAATLGATLSKKHRHFVSLEAHVHVGSYDLDNSNFVVANNELIDGSASIQLPLDATPRSARRAAWLATDAAYKEALSQLEAKRDVLRASGSQQRAASYTKEKPFVQEEPVLVPPLEPLADLDKRARAISAIFRDKEHVRESRVAFTSFLERRWYLNSEGTSATDTRRVSGAIVVATGQADDGQELADYTSHYGLTDADLPGDKQLIAEAKAIARRIAELQKADQLRRYVGPVLFEGVAAAGIIRHGIAAHLGGTPVPEGLPANEAKRYGGLLDDRVGRRILPRALSAFDDPSIHRYRKQALIGGYRFDDEGVPAQRVKVVDNGRLEELLTSRTPSKNHTRSNGHARRTAPGGVFRGSATNLVFTARRGMSPAQLKRRLIQAVRAEDLDFGLIIRRLDDAAVTASPELSARQMLYLFQKANPLAPPPALVAYKVYPNGKEELVRGVKLEEMNIGAWKDILAVGRNSTVFNFLASPEPYIVHKLNGHDNFVPSAGIESAVVTPDLLFEELEIGNVGAQRPEPIVPRPSPDNSP